MQKFHSFFYTFLCSIFILQTGAGQQVGRPIAIKTEYLSNPIGIQEDIPRFSWEFEESEPGFLQSACEIIVSDNLQDIQNTKGNIWSSGKIQSQENIQVLYKGPPLKSFTRYQFKIKVYDSNDQPSEWSGVNWFETSALQTSDWKAKWIGDGSVNPSSDSAYYQPDRMPLFRTDFSTKKKINRAVLYASGMGYYEAYLNGEKIGDRVLDPGFTTYAEEVLFSAYDVTGYIKKDNTLGFMLGNGWWNPLPFKFFGRWDLRDYQQTGRPCVFAELHISYGDGSVEKIVTDEKWKYFPGPVVKNNIYLGETYDARLEVQDWSRSVKQKVAWKNAEVVEGPSGKLSSQMQPPIRITQIVKPVKITRRGADTFMVDMGQNFAGVARIHVKGEAGRKISLRYGEDVFEDGSLNVMTTVATQIKKGGIKGGPGAPETAWQEDAYICKGHAIETWHPRFTFHGFRYVEVSGWLGDMALRDIEGLRMNSDLQSTGNFACSNQQLNKLHEIIQWTFLSNVFSVQSDCPGREKMGYGGDMVATAQSFIYNYQMAQFYRKAVSDFSNDQRPEGGITEIAPFTGIADRGYGDLSGPLGWQLAFPFLQKQLYDFYGDKKIVENNYAAFVKQMDFLQSKAVDHLFYWDISDHEALDAKPEAFSASAFYYHHAVLGEFFASVLDKPADSARYHILAESIKNAIVRKYLVQQTGRFDNATQSAQLFALYYHVSPEDSLSFARLVDEFHRHDDHLSTGIFSTAMLFNVLGERSEHELLYKIATQPDFPGWLHMLNNGATTLWETWAYPETGPSQNHPMFGSIEEWFYETLLGINNGGNAFKDIIIKPQPSGDLTWAKGNYHSIRGNITSDWRISDGKFKLTVAVPPNTNARIFVPALPGEKIYVDATSLNLPYENGYSIFECGSGTYHFSTRAKTVSYK